MTRSTGPTFPSTVRASPSRTSTRSARFAATFDRSSSTAIGFASEAWTCRGRRRLAIKIAYGPTPAKGSATTSPSCTRSAIRRRSEASRGLKYAAARSTRYRSPCSTWTVVVRRSPAMNPIWRTRRSPLTPRSSTATRIFGFHRRMARPIASRWDRRPSGILMTAMSGSPRIPRRSRARRPGSRPPRDPPSAAAGGRPPARCEDASRGGRARGAAFGSPRLAPLGRRRTRPARRGDAASGG